MAASTIPALSIGAVTIFNNSIVGNDPIADQGRVVIGTVTVALALGLVEQVAPQLASGIAYLGLVTVLFVRITPSQPAPVERLAVLLSAATDKGK